MTISQFVVIEYQSLSVFACLEKSVNSYSYCLLWQKTKYDADMLLFIYSNGHKLVYTFSQAEVNAV